MSIKERIISIRILDRQKEYPLYYEEMGVSGKIKLQHSEIRNQNMKEVEISDEGEVSIC
jgi:hypothetical protein